MLNILRILILLICISTELTLAAPIDTVEPTEALENTYVQLEINSDYTASISILKTAEKIIQNLKNKYYSLLNWKSYTRKNVLNIPKYKRIDQFGRWINDPNDDVCYNTRALVLIRDSNQQVVFSDNNKCSVVEGVWKDDYTGLTFTKREEIQIDHFVPLKNAYISGAYKWNFKARCLYANFLGNRFHLKSVNANQNMKKSDKAPDKYMPPNADYACRYIKNWLSVKFLWGLRMTSSESQAIYQLLRDNKCTLSDYKMSATDIIKQNQFVSEHSELCAEVDPNENSSPQPLN